MDVKSLINTYMEELRKFLIAANKAGYVTGNERQWTKEKNRSTTIKFKLGKWSMDDNFFGGEPYGGRAVVFYNGKPFWIMVYYGQVNKGIDPESIYPFLRKALSKMPVKYPYRGPARIKEGSLEYVNKWKGGIDSYSGEERILEKGREVYKASYMGGLIDQRGGV